MGTHGDDIPTVAIAGLQAPAEPQKIEGVPHGIQMERAIAEEEATESPVPPPAGQTSQRRSVSPSSSSETRASTSATRSKRTSQKPTSPSSDDSATENSEDEVMPSKDSKLPEPASRSAIKNIHTPSRSPSKSPSRSQAKSTRSAESYTHEDKGEEGEHVHAAVPRVSMLRSLTRQSGTLLERADSGRPTQSQKARLRIPDDDEDLDTEPPKSRKGKNSPEVQKATKENEVAPSRSTAPKNKSASIPAPAPPKASPTVPVLKRPAPAGRGGPAKRGRGGMQWSNFG